MIDQAIAATEDSGNTRWMDTLIRPEPWMQDALCAQTDPEMFFPQKGGSTRNAKRVCASCDVREQCLEYALRTKQDDGIWGGKSAIELRKMRKNG